MIIIGIALAGAMSVAGDIEYQFIKEIPVGGNTQWDYLKVDPEVHRLYLSHATKVEVINITGPARTTQAPT